MKIFICQYCGRETTNTGANGKHEKHCKSNPNYVKAYRSPSAGARKGSTPWNKGAKGSWFVELLDNEEFDDKKLVYTITETDYGDYVDKVFYNKIELEAHYDDCDSRGKGYFAMVGWLNTRWHGQGDWTTEELTSAWDEYEFQMSSENP